MQGEFVDKRKLELGNGGDDGLGGVGCKGRVTGWWVLGACRAAATVTEEGDGEEVDEKEREEGGSAREL